MNNKVSDTYLGVHSAQKVNEFVTSGQLSFCHTEAEALESVKQRAYEIAPPENGWSYHKYSVTLIEREIISKIARQYDKPYIDCWIVINDNKPSVFFEEFGLGFVHDVDYQLLINIGPLAYDCAYEYLQDIRIPKDAVMAELRLSNFDVQDWSDEGVAFYCEMDAKLLKFTLKDELAK